MKRISLIVFFIFICLPNVKAWNLLQANGGRTRSLGNCSVALNDFWSCHNNPAGTANIGSISFGVSYSNKFLLKELGYKAAGILYPLNIGVLTASFSQFGYELYNENIISLGFARYFGPKLRIGLKLDYLFFKFSGDYKNRSAPTFELGMQYQINESLCLGAYIFNPIYVKTNTINKDKIPVILRLGISYNINENFMITSEIEENTEYNFSYRLGLEYKIYKNIFVRSGLQLNPEIFTFGFGYEHIWFTADISAQMDRTFGASLSCSFVFKINRKK